MLTERDEHTGRSQAPWAACVGHHRSIHTVQVFAGTGLCDRSVDGRVRVPEVKSAFAPVFHHMRICRLRYHRVLSTHLLQEGEIWP